MKAFAKIGISACLLMAAGLMYGCGDDDYTQTGSVTKAPVAGAVITFGNPGEHPTVTSDANGKFALRYPGARMTSTGGTYYDLGTKGQKTAPTLKASAGANNITALTTVVADAPDQASANALIAAFQKLGVAYDAPLDAVSADGANRSAMAVNELIGELLNNNAVSAANVTSFLTSLVTQINALPAGTDLKNPDNIVGAVTTAAAAVPAVNAALTAPAAGDTILNNIVGTIKNIQPNNPLPTGTTGGTGGSGTGGNF